MRTIVLAVINEIIYIKINVLRTKFYEKDVCSYERKKE